MQAARRVLLDHEQQRPARPVGRLGAGSGVRVNARFSA